MKFKNKDNTLPRFLSTDNCRKTHTEDRRANLLTIVKPVKVHKTKGSKIFLSRPLQLDLARTEGSSKGRGRGRG